MDDKKMLEKIDPAEWRFPLDGQKKEKSLYFIRQGVEQKRIKKRPSFAENVWNQLRFQSWKHWAAQGGVLFAAMLLIVQLRKNEADGVGSIAACSVFLVFAGNICLSGVAHLFSWHMAELEKTLYLDLKQMVCIRMFEAGVADLLILLLLTGAVGRVSEAGIVAYLLYMLVPFLWSDVLYLYMLSHFRSVFGGLWQFSAGVFCAVLALFPSVWEGAYDPGVLPVWGMLAVAGFLFLTMQIYKIMGKIEGGESICLN